MFNRGTKTTQGITGGGELSTEGDVRPWEDRTASASERFASYKAVAISKVAEILEASKREGITHAERQALMEDPETQFWAHEQSLLLKETPEQFCERIDRKLIPKLLSTNFLGAAQWQRGFGVDVGEVPQLPESITRELLESECPLHPGEKIKDTHILVLIPQTVDGKPYSVLKLDELCARRKGTGDRLIYDGADWAKKWKELDWAQALQLESEWVLIPKSDPNPEKMGERYPADGDERHFRNKLISRPQQEREPNCKRYQADVHAKYYPQYREAKAVEVMTAALLNDLVNGEPRMLTGYNYLRCVEPNASGGRVCVGVFIANGWKVFDDGGDVGNAGFGRALARKT